MTAAGPGAHASDMRPIALVTILAFIAGCQPMSTVDPSKVERAVRKMEDAAKATAEAIEAAREAAPQPETDVPLEPGAEPPVE